jgi:23S rRNA pseudouridine1911/1915/1917 synthase
MTPTRKEKVIPTVKVAPGEGGLRIDKFLAMREDLGLTRTRIEKLIDSGDILVNGESIVSRYKVGVGDSISITLPIQPKSDLIAENLDIEIVYEDNYLAVVNKPAGMVTHPASGNHSGTLVNALLHHLKSPATGGDPMRPGIVHRLDKNTSGLLVVAKTEEAFAALQKMIAAREITRTYWAIVCGHMKELEGTIDLPIGRSHRDRKKMVVAAKHSREARTHYKIVERYKSYDQLEITLETGRTHQIRVHLAHLGHPVLGDPEYGGRESWHKGLSLAERLKAKKILSDLHRQALHAIRLEFAHPVTGTGLKFEAELPRELDDMKSRVCHGAGDVR